MDVVAQTGEDTAQTETQGGSWDEPAGANPFAEGGAGDLEEDVADIERGKDGIIIVALEVEILLKTGETSIADVGSVDETEEIQKRDSGDDAKIDLQTQPSLGSFVEDEDGVA